MCISSFRLQFLERKLSVFVRVAFVELSRQCWHIPTRGIPDVLFERHETVAICVAPFEERCP
jgi:hypothetical protein